MEARVGMASHGGVVDSGAARKFLQPPPQPPQPQQQACVHQQSQMGSAPQLLAGGVAGAFSKTCTAPLARLTILFQVQGMHSDAAKLSRPSLWHETLRIVNEEGFRAFWKGNLVTIIHRLPYSSVSFYAFERYRTLLKTVPAVESRKDIASTGTAVDFVSGGLAGMTAASVTYPLDLVRTRLATQRSTVYYQGIVHTIRTICRDEGFCGLYKGLGATLLGVGPSLAISFSVYETMRSYWRLQRPDDSTIVSSLACGSVAGIASSTATFPSDLVRRRMQLEGAAGQARVYKTGIFGTFRHIVRCEGLRGLYRGILPEYYKVVPTVGIVFMTYETLKKLLAGESFRR